MTIPVAVPPQQPNPADRLSGYAVAWLGFVAYFVVVETIAIRQDARTHDRVKRTLTANLRYVFATDSVTGIPLAVRFGRLRRFGFASAETWLRNHVERPGSM